MLGGQEALESLYRPLGIVLEPSFTGRYTYLETTFKSFLIRYLL